MFENYKIKIFLFFFRRLASRFKPGQFKSHENRHWRRKRKGIRYKIQHEGSLRCYDENKKMFHHLDKKHVQSSSAITNSTGPAKSVRYNRGLL